MKRRSTFTFQERGYILLMLLYSIVNYGQSLGNNNSYVVDLPQVIPPSPTVASLMHFEEVPVDAYTGQPNISIPLFSKGLDGGLGFSAALGYNTSGIRVEERSGWTGTGWSLFAGGVISRTVLGVHDDAFIEGGSPYVDGEVGTFHSGYYKHMKYIRGSNSGNTLISVVNSDFQDYQNFLWNTKYGPQTYDYQPDLFQFNFMGYSGRFIVLNDNGTLKPKLLSSSQKVKIELSYNTTTFEISSFTVITPNGYKFLFDQKEITTPESRRSAIGQSGDPLDNSLQPVKEVNYTSSWHLSSIKSPSNYVVCSFSYQDVGVDFDTPKSTQKASVRNNPSLYSSYFSRSNSNAGYNSSLVPPASVTTGAFLR